MRNLREPLRCLRTYLGKNRIFLCLQQLLRNRARCKAMPNNLSLKPLKEVATMQMVRSKPTIMVRSMPMMWSKVVRKMVTSSISNLRKMLQMMPKRLVRNLRTPNRARCLRKPLMKSISLEIRRRLSLRALLLWPPMRKIQSLSPSVARNSQPNQKMWNQRFQSRAGLGKSLKSPS